MTYLAMRGISKNFGPLIANSNVDLLVERGEIHGLMGENGAGKSTLMAILYGMLSPNSGVISLDGQPVVFSGPLDAIASGIAMVHQSFKLFSALTAWENLVYHCEPTVGPFIAARAARRIMLDLGQRYNMPIDPDATVGQLSIGLQQRLEILKALYRRARILILDEPTAVLTPLERDTLFVALRTMADRGMTVILVTHKIPEVMAITDRITILRGGKSVAQYTTKQCTELDIVRAMTGREVVLPKNPKGSTIEAEIMLSVRGLGVRVGERKAVLDVSLDVRGGEIVGIAGIAGNGQSELVAAIGGLVPATGSVFIGGRDVSELGVADRRALGFAYVPEDRHLTGTAPSGSVVDNIAFGSHRRRPFSRFGFLQLGAMRRYAHTLISRFAIKAEKPTGPVASLSGGNMQKLVVARELGYGASLLVFEQPTRGVDIGAIEFIHNAMISERNCGRAILLVSSELSELVSLSDRVLVMYCGRIVAELKCEGINEIEMGRWMAGGGIAS